MLPELHEALRELIYQEGRIDRSEVDIAFEAPTKEYIDKLPHPTIDLYLVEMQENLELRQAQFQAGRVNGHGQFKAMPKRMDLRYLVTALTTNSEDAYRLLWRAVGVLIRTPELPAALLPDDFHLEAPIVARVAQFENSLKLLDVWSAIGTEPRTSFGLVITVPVDMELGFEAPLVLTTTIGFKSMADERLPESRTFIRGVIRTKAGAGVSDATVAIVGDEAVWTRTLDDGGFILHTPHAGKIKVRVTAAGRGAKTFDVVIPAQSYDLQVD